MSLGGTCLWQLCGVQDDSVQESSLSHTGCWSGCPYPVHKSQMFSAIFPCMLVPYPGAVPEQGSLVSSKLYMHLVQAKTLQHAWPYLQTVATSSDTPLCPWLSRQQMQHSPVIWVNCFGSDMQAYCTMSIAHRINLTSTR